MLSSRSGRRTIQVAFSTRADLDYSRHGQDNGRPVFSPANRVLKGKHRKTEIRSRRVAAGRGDDGLSDFALLYSTMVSRYMRFYRVKPARPRSGDAHSASVLRNLG